MRKKGFITDELKGGSFNLVANVLRWINFTNKIDLRKMFH